MSCSLEADLPPTAAKTLEALEVAGNSLIDRCKGLRQNPIRVRPEQLEKLVLSAISTVQSIWNTITPIHHLPIEVLVHIFSLVPKGCPVSYTNPHWRFTCPDIDINLRLATVCKHWRNLILETPALWSIVSESGLYSRRLNIWGLPRCPRGPLSVYVCDKISPRMWRLLKSEGHRIRQLHMACTIEADVEAILALLQSFPATSLEHCMISDFFPVLENQQKRSLFSGDGRTLRSLYLHMVSFLPSNTFPSLSCLIIDCTTYSGKDPHWDLGDLLNLLVRCPRLERLHLSSTWNWPYRTSISADASRVILPHLRIFTLDLEDRLITATVEALLSIIELPRTCQIQLALIPLNGLQAISSSLLSLGRPFTKMHLEFAAAVPSRYWSLDLASHQPNYAAVRLLFHPARESEVPGLLGPNFSKLPLFDDVEELWCRTDLLHEDMLRPILLPRNVRGLALTIVRVKWGLDVSSSCFAQVARACGQLDTLCICVPEQEHLGGAREALTSPGRDGKPRCRAIRRLAVGYESSTAWLPGEPLRDCGVGTEVCWTGQIAGKSGDDTEMDRLLSAAPQVLEEPASIRTRWPTWSSFLWY